MVLNQACRHHEDIDEQALFRTIYPGIGNLSKVIGQARDWLCQGVPPSAHADEIGGMPW